MTAFSWENNVGKAADLQKREKARSHLKTVIAKDIAWTMLCTGHSRGLVRGVLLE